MSGNNEHPLWVREMMTGKKWQRQLFLILFIAFWWLWAAEAIGAITGWYHLGVLT